MKKMILNSFGLALLLLTAFEATAQDYKNAIGGRFGSYNGVSYKTFLSPDRAVDLNLGFRKHNSLKDASFTALTRSTM